MPVENVRGCTVLYLVSFGIGSMHPAAKSEDIIHPAKFCILAAQSEEQSATFCAR